MCKVNSAIRGSEWAESFLILRLPIDRDYHQFKYICHFSQQFAHNLDDNKAFNIVRDFQQAGSYGEYTAFQDMIITTIVMLSVKRGILNSGQEGATQAIQRFARTCAAPRQKLTKTRLQKCTAAPMLSWSYLYKTEFKPFQC